MSGKAARYETASQTTPWRLVPVRANDQLALAGYQQHQDGGPVQLGLVGVFEVREGRVRGITAFLDPATHGRRGLASILPPA